MKKTKSKWIEWTEEVFLFKLPVPVGSYPCFECGHTTWEWAWRGFIKIREIKHRRKKTAQDVTNQRYFDRMIERLESDFGALEKGAANKIRFHRQNISLKEER